MSAELLLREFARVADAPGAIVRMRRFVLDLAVTGRIVPQNPDDPPASISQAPPPARRGRTSSTFNLWDNSQSKYSPGLPPGWTHSTLGAVAECLDSMREPVNNTERATRIEGKSPEQLFPYFGATQQQGWIDEYLFDEELVLLGEDGAPFLDPYRPKAYLVTGKSWVNNHAHVLRSKAVSNPYLVLALNACDYQGRVMGATRSKLNQGQMLAIPVRVPPIAEQHRIVAKVNEMMELCDQLEAAQKEREVRRDRLRVASLHRLTSSDGDSVVSNADMRFFVDRSPRLISKPGHVEAVRQAILGLAVRGHLVPHDPQGWVQTTLGEVCSKITDGTHRTPTYVERGVPFVSIKDFSTGHLDFGYTRFISREEHIRLVQRCRPERGDILIGRIGTLGKPVVVDTDKEFSLFVSVGLLKPRREIVAPEYLRAFLDSPTASAAFDRIKVGGGTHTNKLNLADLKALALALPSLTEQLRIVAKVRELMVVCDNLEAALASTHAHRGRLLESLLHQALAGGTSAT